MFLFLSPLSLSNTYTHTHTHTQFEYEKCFREHKGAKTFHPYAEVLKTIYLYTLRWTYNILLMGVGVVLTVMWGVLNAATAFFQTWFISPSLRVSLVIVKGFLPLVLEPMGMCMKTLCVAMGAGPGSAGLCPTMGGMGGMGGLGGLGGLNELRGGGIFPQNM